MKIHSSSNKFDKFPEIDFLKINFKNPSEGSLDYQFGIQINREKIEEGEKVVADGIQIGSVKTVMLNKESDSAFILIKLNKGMKIPVGSFFYLHESLLGSSFINVEYSNENKFLRPRDFIIGRLQKH